MADDPRQLPQEAVLADYDVPVVRTAKIGDAAAVGGLMEQAGLRNDTQTVEKRIASLCGHDSFRAFVAELRGRVIGVLTVQMLPFLHLEASGAIVVMLVVHKGYRRQGVGTVLLRTVECFARARGCVSMRVLSHNSRMGPHEFFGRLGYSIDSDRTCFHRSLG